MTLIPMKYRKEIERMNALSLLKAFVAKDKLSFIAVYLCEDSVVAAIVLAKAFGIHLGIVQLPLWGAYLAVSLICIGELVRLWSTYTLGKFFTYVVVIARDHKLVRKGPYRFVRHPGYFGGLLIFLGFGIASQSWIIGATIVVLLCLAYVYRIHVEENALRQKFGAKYEEYSRSTAMIIPYLF
ncbi:MAG: isoprenylcysteine carboxylmethyltransferase family protein [Candidatus Micrarchaeota archaeon]|nr:isoprenylcysteine carboxylmethyltransferase family protein [Candidatus Micrarchaeota archaeon]